jgi:hypothetical protein
MIPRELLERFEQFAWGERDCVHFAAAVREHFGAAAVEIPAYSTEAEAKRIIASSGGLKKMLTDRLGPMQSPEKAQIGDTVLATFASVGEIVGVAAPPNFWLLVGQSGLFIPVSLTLAVGVWPCRA